MSMQSPGGKDQTWMVGDGRRAQSPENGLQTLGGNLTHGNRRQGVPTAGLPSTQRRMLIAPTCLQLTATGCSQWSVHGLSAPCPTSFCDSVNSTVPARRSCCIRQRFVSARIGSNGSIFLSLIRAQGMCLQEALVHLKFSILNIWAQPLPTHNVPWTMVGDPTVGRIQNDDS